MRFNRQHKIKINKPKLQQIDYNVFGGGFVKMAAPISIATDATNLTKSQIKARNKLNRAITVGSGGNVLKKLRQKVKDRAVWLAKQPQPETEEKKKDLIKDIFEEIEDFFDSIFKIVEVMLKLIVNLTGMSDLLTLIPYFLILFVALKVYKSFV